MRVERARLAARLELNVAEPDGLGYGEAVEVAGC